MPIEYTIIISVVSVACTVLGVSVGYSNLRRHQSAEDRDQGALLASIEVKLGHVTEGIAHIRHDMSDIKTDINEQRERIVRVEESAKQAHKRLDELNGRRAN